MRDAARADGPGSRPPCRRSPTPSVIRRAGASTCSSATSGHGAATRRDGVTAATVAAEVGVHPNVARHHLDKLAAGGYVEVGGAAAATVAGAGRAPVEALRRGPDRRGRTSSRCTATTSCWRCSGRRSPGCRRRRPRRWPRRSARPTAGRSPPGSPAMRSPPGSARCARRCRPSPTRSPPTASPPARASRPSPAAPRPSTDCASSATTARSATSPSITRCCAPSTAAWCAACSPCSTRVRRARRRHRRVEGPRRHPLRHRRLTRI